MIVQLKAKIKYRKHQMNNKFYEEFARKVLLIPSDHYKLKNKLEVLSDKESLTISMSVDLSKNIAEFGEEDDVFNRISVGSALSKQEFQSHVFDIYFAIQLSYPGLIDFSDINFYLNNVEYGYYYNKLINPTFFSVEFLEEDMSFYYQDIAFDDVWEWLMGFEDYWIETPRTSLGRAINYLRYVFFEASPMSVYWSFMAVESLMVTNQSFSKSQIQGKTKALTDYYKYDEIQQNKIKSLYKFRSKIAHGQQVFYRPILQHDALKDVERIDLEIDSAGRLTHVILLMGIQYLILNKIYCLEFNEIIKYDLI